MANVPARKIAVVGGGLAGLTVSKALRHFAGAQVFLYERKSSPLIPVDRGIGIWPLAKECLRDLSNI